MSFDPFDPFDAPDFDEDNEGDFSEESDTQEHDESFFDFHVDSIHWRTREGEILTPSEMKTSHLFNCVRMIFNHTAPDEMKLRPFKHWPGWDRAPSYQKRVCVTAFLRELLHRSDLGPEQIDQLRHMAACTREAWPATANLIS
jgi:hypothetical protein